MAGDPRAGRLDARFRTSLAAVALCGVVFALVALALCDARTAFSVACGGGLAAGNLWVLGRVVAELLPADGRAAAGQSRAAWALVAAVKMVGLVAVVWLLMRRGIVSPLPMLVGFGALPIGIAIGSLVSDRSGKSEDP